MWHGLDGRKYRIELFGACSSGTGSWASEIRGKEHGRYTYRNRDQLLYLYLSDGPVVVGYWGLIPSIFHELVRCDFEGRAGCSI